MYTAAPVQKNVEKKGGRKEMLTVEVETEITEKYERVCERPKLQEFTRRLRLRLVRRGGGEKGGGIPHFK